MNRIKVFFACAMVSMAFSTAVLAQDHRHTQRNDSVEEEMLATVAETVQTEPEFDIYDHESMEKFINNTVEESLDSALSATGDRPGYISRVAGGVSIAIIAIISFFFGPVILVAIILYFIYKRKKQRDQVVIAAINKGVEIPAGYGGSYSRSASSSSTSEAPRSYKSAPADQSMMHNGIKNISVGLGLVILSFYLHLGILGGIGWMVVIYGVGKLAIAYLSGEKTIRKEEPKYTRTVEKVQEDEKSE